MKTAEAMQGKEDAVLENYGFRITGNKHIDCPICGGIKKFRIHKWKGNVSYICVCGHGDIFKLLREVTKKDFITLAREIDALIGNQYVPGGCSHAPDMSLRDKAISIFRSGERLRGSTGEAYLNSRGIYEMPTGGAVLGRYQGHECIIALGTTEFSEPRQMHCTFIHDGAKIAVGGAERKMFGLSPLDARDRIVSEPISIKLFEAGDILGVAEGIETALSAKQLYKMPVWSLMNATFMKKFRAPTGVRCLYIYADNDKNLTGLAAAMDCGRSNLLCSNEVEMAVIRWPKKLNDFNDLLLNGDDVLEWRGCRR